MTGFQYAQGAVLGIANWMALVCATIAVVLASLNYIHMLQLESYQGKMYLKWVGKRFFKEVVPFIMTGVVAALLRVCFAFFESNNALVANICMFASDVVYVAMLLFMALFSKKQAAKKPLVYTGRVIRLIIVEAVIVFFFTAAFFYSYTPLEGHRFPWFQYLLPIVLRYLPGATVPLFIMLAYLITWPVEQLIKRGYYNDARSRLRGREGLIKIGITGSYGKTSTKYALGAILSQKYNVLFTPGSYNTTMGVTRVIREQLTCEHEVFIAEMGARYKGDIAELCDLVEPQYGIITSIGKQHLETFGSLEWVIRTKSELAEALPGTGVLVLNGDNQYCRNINNASHADTVFFGEGEDSFSRISDISVAPQGSSFTLTLDGERIECTTKLLGRHNMMNIAAAAALAKKLGLTGSEIAAGIAKIEPVEHRLQLISGANGSMVIDDAFNANPEGAREAMEVLKLFPGKKIVVTPGMVELGAEEDALNREFGREMAGAADVAILIGKSHVDPIREGLTEAGFDADSIVGADTLDDAAIKLQSYTTPGCVILFLNDLPDNYNE